MKKETNMRRVTLEISQRGHGLLLEAIDPDYSKDLLNEDVATIKKVFKKYKSPPDITTNVVIRGQIWEEIREELEKPK